MIRPANPFLRSLPLCLGLLLLLAVRASAQQSADLTRALERLDQLEKQNAALSEEIRQLRAQLATLSAQQAAAPSSTSGATLADKVAIAETRIEEHAQTKVESGQRLPVRLYGTLLLNAFANSRNSGGYVSSAAGASSAPAYDDATLRQSIVGLSFHGPVSVGGARVSGQIEMDFFPYTDPSQTTPNLGLYDEGLTPRLRTALLTLDWGSRAVSVGREKPIIAPRNPDSLAQVGQPALSDAGNLWIWQPQVRVEQRFRAGTSDVVTAQLSVLSTREYYTNVNANYLASLERVRPGYEGRIEWARRRDGETRFAIAPGFHFSTTHVAGGSVASRVFSLDGMARPWRDVAWSGAYYVGENASGIGALSPGFVVYDARVRGVRQSGGWAQLTLFPERRWSVHVFGGLQANNGADLRYSTIETNASYAANLYYRLAQNVVLAFEASQLRTSWWHGPTRLRNHYDLALAYFF